MVALTCILVILTSVVMAVPRIQSVIKYEEIISSVGGREVAESKVSTTTPASTSNNNSDDVFDNANGNSNTKETTYADTDEYKNKQNIITKMADRYADITDNDLMESLSLKTGKYFTAYSDYLANPTPAKLNALQEYTSTEYFNELKKQPLVEEYYLVADVKFADFDKDVIQSIVILRGGTIKFAVSYIKDSTKGYVINSVRSLNV